MFIFAWLPTRFQTMPCAQYRHLENLAEVLKTRISEVSRRFHLAR